MRGRMRCDEDSLELMLDTICNVFGGVVFIAMLLSLLPREVGVHQPNETEYPADISGTAALSVERQLALLEINRLSHTLESLSATRESLAWAEDGELASAMSILRQRVEEATETKERLERWVREFDHMSQQAQETLEAHRQSARQRVEELTSQLKSEVDANTIQARLPRSRVTHKTQYLLILSGGRVYWAPYNRDKALGLALSRDFADQVAISEMPGGGQRIELREDRGIPIGEDFAECALGRVVFAQGDPATDVFPLLVHQDSVDAFTRVKRSLLLRGFQYDVWTQEEGAAMVVFPADSAVAQ